MAEQFKESNLKHFILLCYIALLYAIKLIVLKRIYSIALKYDVDVTYRRYAIVSSLSYVSYNIQYDYDKWNE